MRIALITDGIWPYVLGGMQKHSYYLCKYLALQKVQVDLFHFNQSNYNIEQLEFFSEEEKKYINATVIDFPDTAKGYGHYIVNSYRYSLAVYDKLKDNINSFDFIYTKGFTGWHLIREKKRSETVWPPIGVNFHGFEMFQKAPGFKARLQQVFLLRKPVKEICLNADVVFSYGGKITEIIRSIDVPDAKIIECPAGVETSAVVENIVPSEKNLNFLFLGRYERRKGIEELSKAILMLKPESNKSVTFHFIGPIPEDKKLHAQNVVYHGEIRDKQILNQLIRKCDVLVCPSWSEGMPNAILESMANGLAIIATDVGATNILVNEKTGWLIDSSKPKTILNAINNVILSGPSGINKRKQNALDLIREKFTWEKLIGDLIKKLENHKLR